MVKAIWNGVILAESDDTVVVERNHYFPADSIQSDYFEPSDTESLCPWKGIARYYTIKVGDAVNRDAAWYYPEASDAAKNIEGYVAFWKGVEVSDRDP